MTWPWQNLLMAAPGHRVNLRKRAEPLYAEWADFAWLTKEEALERLRGQPVAALASRMLLD